MLPPVLCRFPRSFSQPCRVILGGGAMAASSSSMQYEHVEGFLTVEAWVKGYGQGFWGYQGRGKGRG